MLASAAVVAADVYLMVMVLRIDAGAFAGWKPVILVGIATVFLFAMYRFRRLLRLFLHDE